MDMLHASSQNMSSKFPPEEAPEVAGGQNVVVGTLPRLCDRGRVLPASRPGIT